jgi:cellulose synthase/poly-beta-1,6-N-acetylglucosamine synthase-like glycosyltransferase
MKVSVVVPTYNRGSALAQTLDRLTASELQQGDELEILVVDDGSAVPAREVVASTVLRAAPASWPVRWLRQINAGPAAARNAGFRAADGELVLFIDDDILAPHDLVRAHVAAHRAHPLSVIFGPCPFVPASRPTPFRSFVEETQRGSSPMGEITRAPIVASGQISVERRQFAEAGAVYSPEMTTPAAEEYELTFRLRARGIPILMAPDIVALHDQQVDVTSYCRQQYKHGIGCGEAAAKRPELLDLTELARVVHAAHPDRSGDGRSGEGLVKTVLTRPRSRAALLRLARGLEHVPVPDRLRFAAYRAAVAAHFVAGVRDGLSRFSPARTEARHGRGRPVPPE